MATTLEWHIAGDWFDVCSCDIPCPCSFAQPPTNNACSGVLAYHIREGNYGDTSLDGLNFIAVGAFEGNLWADPKNFRLGFFFDERSNEQQRAALQIIFSGQVGGFPAVLAAIWGEVQILGAEVVPIHFEVAEDLAFWGAEIPGKIIARGEALTGPTTLEGKRVQTLNLPGCETGPGQVATWGKATTHYVEAFGLKWEWNGKSSKHIPFDWSGPGRA